ncbi:MAG: ABC transporter ATP-binding protein [Treponema sp.]
MMKINKKRTENRGTIVRIAALMRPYTVLLVLSLLLGVAVVVSTLYIPVLSGRAVDDIAGKGRVDFTSLGKILLQMCTILGITAVSQWCMTVFTNHAAYKIVKDMRTAAFGKLQRLPLSYIDSHSRGDIVSRIITDVDQFSEGLLMGFAQLFTGVLTIFVTLVFMFCLNPFITLVVIGVTPVSMFVAAFIAKKTYVHFKNQSEKRGAVTSIVQEMIEGMSCVRTFNMMEKVCSKFNSADEELRDASFKAVFYSSVTNPATRFFNALVFAGVGIFGALSAIAGTITVGELAAFLGYASQYTKPFNEISGVVTELQNSIACAQRLFELIDADEISSDSSGAAVLTGVQGNVSLKDVAFSYNPGEPLIEDLSLNILPGQRIAIVGPTGCGKTTLINLLMRFYDVNSGSIYIDGHDIRTVTRNSLRSSYGMVLQDTWLKYGTVRENITMGKPDATDEETVHAAQEAYADGFIRRLPYGYDTIIGDSGDTLSAGQRQLLCIARVMLAVPPMLILDEATSSIDTRTELCIQKAFDKLMEGRTSFVVAHRLSTIRNADRILVMKHGHIVETGKHEELLAAGGFYAELYNSQFETV